MLYVVKVVIQLISASSNCHWSVCNYGFLPQGVLYSIPCCSVTWSKGFGLLHSSEHIICNRWL